MTPGIVAFTPAANKQISIQTNKFTMSAEDSDTDIDVDSDVRQMGDFAMKMLETISDEVSGSKLSSSSEEGTDDAALQVRLRAFNLLNDLGGPDGDDTEAEQNWPQRPSLSPPPQSAVPTAEEDLSESEVQYDVPGEALFSHSPANKIQHVDDIDISDDDDDESITSFRKEMNKLDELQREMERELRAHDAESMRRAMSEEEESPDLRKRILSDDDKEIVKRILDDEYLKYEPKNAFERIMKKYYFEGVSSEVTTYCLGLSGLVIWMIVFGLIHKVMHAEILEI